MKENSYAEQMARLTARKNAQTREKLSKLGFRDEDDYGLVLPPESFKADLPVRDATGQFSGPRAWAMNFRWLMEHHPLYHFRTGLAGIRPTSPGFRSAEIAPCPGGLKRIEASVPTPHGAISVDLHFDGDAVRGTVTVPEKLPATFKWRGATRLLAPGENAISF